MDNKVNVKIIVEYLKENNLTRKEFCRQCRISTSTFYKIINGNDFGLQSLFRIAKRMDIRICELFK